MKKILLMSVFVVAMLTQGCGGGSDDSHQIGISDGIKTMYRSLASPYEGNENIYLYGHDNANPLKLSFNGLDDLPLYLFGGEAGLWRNHGGLKRECNELMPTHKRCYFTDPRDMDERYDQDRVCKFLARPTMVVACDDNHCLGEDYYDDCSSGPRLNNNTPKFSPSMTNENKVILSIYEASEIEAHPLSANTYYTLSLDVAEAMASSGRSPMINLSKIVADFKGQIYPDAKQRIHQASLNYPGIFTNPQARFLIIDEPFWTGSGHTDEDITKEQIQLIRKTSTLIREINPKASIGINLAPNYKTHDELQADIRHVSEYIDWIGMDVYVFFGKNSEAQVKQVQTFYDFMKSVYPDKGNMIVLQMFPPIDWKKPSEWTKADSSEFISLMEPLIDFGYLFDHTMIWGGGSVSELPHAYAGFNLPSDVIDFYKYKIIDICK